MPFVTAPPVIEKTDFSLGWCPDLEPSSVPETGLLGVTNLIPDVSTGQPQVRPGFAALPALTTAGRDIRSIHPYQRLDGKVYLMVVATQGTNTAGSTAVYQYDVETDTAVQVSPGGASLGGGGRHFGFVVDDVYYGGFENGNMYSWDGTTFNLDAGTPGVAEAHIANKAYRKGDRVLYNTKTYSANVDWVEEEWSDDNVTYKAGDLVSHRGSWGYYRTFKCTKKHTTIAGGQYEPGVGSVWKDAWKPHNMKKPLDADNKPNTKHWSEVPNPPKTNLAVWHGNRMFARDDAVRSDRVIYSRQSDVKDAAVGSQWNSTDWRVTGSDGAGWLDFKTDDGTGVTALYSFGYYLLVFKTQSTHVIAGVNPETWNVRKLDDVGAVGPRSVTGHNGLVYFLGDRGFYMTDGTVVEEVPGAERMRDWFRSALEYEGAIKDVTLWSFGGFVWISLPTGPGNTPDRVIVYDPATQSFWKQNMHVQAAAVVRRRGVDQLFFSQPSVTGALSAMTYSWEGTRYNSRSVRSDGLINEFYDPSFETFTGSFNLSIYWQKTANRVDAGRSIFAGRRGQAGALVTNKREVESYEGLKQGRLMGAGTYRISFYVRRPDYKTVATKPPVKILVGDTAYDPTFTDAGRGWWRVSYEFTVGVGATNLFWGIGVKNGKSVHVDQAMLHIGAEVPYFDGDGADADTYTATGSTSGRLYQFAKKDPATNAPVHTDDGQPISWAMRTAWFPFGVLKEIRQVRSVWALLRGAVTVSLRVFRNFEDSAASELVNVPTEAVAHHFEGALIPDSFAINFEVSGNESAPGGVAVLGVAANTVPRRVEQYS